jgi:hypothetical protein
MRRRNRLLGTLVKLILMSQRDSGVTEFLAKGGER